MGRVIAIIMVVLVGVLALVWLSQQLSQARLLAVEQTDQVITLQGELATAEREYKALSYEKTALQQELQDLKQTIADLTACNLSLDKQLTAAQNRPVTFAVYQETYPGSPIGKSPFALRFREEGILRTGCGNFIFRAQR